MTKPKLIFKIPPLDLTDLLIRKNNISKIKLKPLKSKPIKK